MVKRMMIPIYIQCTNLKNTFKMITNEQKVSITTKLDTYCKLQGSQAKAANSLKSVSAGTLSQVLNTNWDLITDEMWRNIASQIGWKNDTWITVDTRDAKHIKHFLNDSQTYSNVFAIIGGAGTGKTAALRQYAENNSQVYLLQCNEFWNRKYFLAELLMKMGRSYAGLTVSEMMIEVVMELKKKSQPIIILDEADKLSDQVIYFFITLYNQLEDHCGIVLCATDHLEKRIKRGLNLNKRGYQEIYSRMGRRFIKLKGIGSTDVAQVCAANGVTDRAKIKEIFEDCEYDLRRVKRSIHALRVKG